MHASNNVSSTVEFSAPSLADQAASSPSPRLPDIDAADDPQRAAETILGVFGHTTITAIHPKTSAVESIYLDENTKPVVVAWMRVRSRDGMGLYFNPNEPKHGLKK